MLRLIVGRVGTGKTDEVFREIGQKINAGEMGILLIVPEQYSHAAERQLCRACGDSLSLHAEILSFTRLCGRVFFELGYPARFLDDGGQMLVMHLALESILQKLKVFGAKGAKVELLEGLIEAIKELKSCGISEAALEDIAKQVPDPLSSKLQDLALILSSYDALLSTHGGDMSDMLTILSRVIADSEIGSEGHIYFDGFNDFTAQELRVIEELIKKDAQITVCLTFDFDDDNEIFELPHETAEHIKRLANKYGVEVEEIKWDGSKNTPITELLFLEQNLFSHSPEKYSGKCSAIKVVSASSRYSECEYAANKVWELVKSGYRWRDIAIMSRDWEQYSSICENVFEKFEIPFFSSGRADILDKPPIAFIDAAIEIASSGWEYRAVFRYLKTGLIDICAEDCSMLENYVLKWNIRGNLWHRQWTLPPNGYGADADDERLMRLNNLRMNITAPIEKLRDGIKGTSGADVKLRALYAFLEDTKLPHLLSKKANELNLRGEPRLADEYTQLWDIIANAMDQIFVILEQSMLTAAEFRKILSLVMSRYDVGVIPVSLDRTAMGSMAMSRRRAIKCLVILGATDDNMPMLSKGAGALSENEREELLKFGISIPAGLEQSLCREMNTLYNAFTLPSDLLVVTYPSDAGSRPSFIVKRLLSMYDICEEKAEADSLKALPYYEISGQLLQTVNKQECLSGGVAEQLYGNRISLSPSRVDKYYSCPYQYFLSSGLKLSPRTPAIFDAPMAGSFMHFVLEGASREIKETTGFKNADIEKCRVLAKKYIDKYVKDELFDFEGKNERFIYLFRRLEQDAVRVLSDMLDELKNSEFEPADFELNLSELAKKIQADMPENERAPFLLTGIVDRVDIWKRDEELYLRVVDYKTGKKAFSLSDVMYGRDMQMLIYLFALQQFGKFYYGKDINPAGVLYIPARDVMLSASRNSTEEEISKARLKALKRGGLVLSDPDVIDAMEIGESKQYLPVKLSKDGVFTGDSLASEKQLRLLGVHIDKMLKSAAQKILSGEIGCSPLYKGENDNACNYCDFRSVCAFDEENGDRRRFVKKIKTSEIWQLLNKEVEETP